VLIGGGVLRGADPDCVDDIVAVESIAQIIAQRRGLVDGFGREQNRRHG
jgi:hypothetical protein